MKKFIFIAICLLILTACSTDNEGQLPLPECINIKIQELSKGPIYTPRAHIEKYSYKGQIVYLIDSCPACSDHQVAVISEKCENICRIGGIDGLNTCIDWDKATFIETVWTDPR